MFIHRFTRNSSPVDIDASFFLNIQFPYVTEISEEVKKHNTVIFLKVVFVNTPIYNFYFRGILWYAFFTI